MNRRQAIKRGLGLGIGGVALAGAGLYTPFGRRLIGTGTSGPKRRLPIPRLLESVDGSPIELTMASGQWEILPGKLASTNGFNGPYLGPTVRTRNGENLSVIYKNNLAESVAIHGHGLHVPGSLDGGPQRAIEPGDTLELELPIRQEACTTWYHPHTHNKTAPQTYSGLSGLFIIEDDHSAELRLPKTYGVDDLPLVIQDRTLDRDGKLIYEVEDADDGFLGDRITVNGITDPLANVPAGLVRLRLLNGSNARYYRFMFSDNRVFHAIASDGGFLEEPVPLQEVILTPGERCEIIVDFSDGVNCSLITGPSASSNSERGGNNRNRGRWEPGRLADSFDILEFVVDPSLPLADSQLPAILNSITRPTVNPDWPVRHFDLFMNERGARRNAAGRQGGLHGVMMGINGAAMDMNVINERVAQKQWERWVVRSRDGSHPFHVHGCSFLMLSQEGKPVADGFAGWKDTIRVDDEAEFMVKFDHEATDQFPYMYHCHILEHEDMGMMGQFTVS